MKPHIRPDAILAARISRARAALRQWRDRHRRPPMDSTDWEHAANDVRTDGLLK